MYCEDDRNFVTAGDFNLSHKIKSKGHRNDARWSSKISSTGGSGFGGGGPWKRTPRLHCARTSKPSAKPCACWRPCDELNRHPSPETPSTSQHDHHRPGCRIPRLTLQPPLWLWRHGHIKASGTGFCNSFVNTLAFEAVHVYKMDMTIYHTPLSYSPIVLSTVQYVWWPSFGTAAIKYKHTQYT